MGLEAGSRLKSQGKWLGVGGTFCGTVSTFSPRIYDRFGLYSVGRKQLAVHDGPCQWLETLSPTSHQEFQLNSRLMV